MSGVSLEFLSILMASVVVIFAAVFACIGNTVILRQFIAGLTRQPEAKDTLLTSTLISVGLLEALPIIAVVVGLILLFGNPLLK